MSALPSAVILALETSQRGGGVAVRDRSGAVHQETLIEAKRHDDDLMPAIDRLMRRVGLRPADLDVIGLSIGPGGFTGLRIGVSTVKMLALATGARVVEVPTALVVARGSVEVEVHRTIFVALASKRGTFWGTRLTWSHAEGWAVATEGLRDVDGANLAAVDALVADEHQPAELSARAKALGLAVVPARYDAGACLAEVARAAGAGRFIDTHELAPRYPRPPEAVSLWDAREGELDS